MSITEQFDLWSHGAVSIDMKTRRFTIGSVARKVTKGQAAIIASFIHLANNDAQASVKTMQELCDSSDENAFKARLSIFRKSLSDLEIAPGVSADSLFLSDTLIGRISDIEDVLGFQKLPYHFNTKLADLITEFGNNVLVIDEEKLRDDELEVDPSKAHLVCRLKPIMIASSKKEPERFSKALAKPVLTV